MLADLLEFDLGQCNSEKEYCSLPSIVSIYYYYLVLGKRPRVKLLGLT